MIKIDPLVRGEPKTVRVTFLNADDESIIDCTGWTLYCAIGRSRSDIGGVAEVYATADAVSGAQGQVSVTIPAELTSLIAGGSASVEFSVDSGSGSRTPILLAAANVQSPDEYRQQYYQSPVVKSQVLSDTPMVVQGSASATQEIKLSLSVNLDPAFDLGVLVKFSELSPETKAYLDGLAADVSTKHAEVMGV